MSGAAAHVIQLVRSHYRGDEAAFKAAAEALGRASKLPRVRESIQDLVRSGASQAQQRRYQATPPNGGVLRSLPLDSGGLLHPVPAVTFSDLLLEPALQSLLDEVVVELEYRQQLADRNLRPRSRLLLHGPPGNGKSSAGAAIANAIGIDAYMVSLPDVVSMYLGGTGGNLGKLFESVSSSRIVIFDELDAIGSSRSEGNGSGASKEQNATVNVLLTMMDRVRSGIIIATTNRVEMLDAALRRRFDEELFFPAPNIEQMRSLAVKVSERHSVDPPHVDDCKNFDEVTKRCLTHARRIAMVEILAAEAAEGEDDGKQEEDNEKEN